MLDTSTVILLGRIEDPADLPDEAMISAITLAELSVGPHVAHSDEERAARQAHLQQAESDFDVLVFDAESARAFGGSCRIVASVRPKAGGTRLWCTDRRQRHCLRPAAIQLQSVRL
jgi:predicted nucleic acid-binding protein